MTDDSRSPARVLPLGRTLPPDRTVAGRVGDPGPLLPQDLPRAVEHGPDDVTESEVALRVRSATLAARDQALRESIDRLASKLKKLPGQELELARLQ